MQNPIFCPDALFEDLPDGAIVDLALKIEEVCSSEIWTPEKGQPRERKRVFFSTPMQNRLEITIWRNSFFLIDGFSAGELIGVKNAVRKDVYFQIRSASKVMLT
ncbi:hypothetical protein [Flagellimonas marinaquae]